MECWNDRRRDSDVSEYCKKESEGGEKEEATDKPTIAQAMYEWKNHFLFASLVPQQNGEYIAKCIPGLLKSKQLVSPSFLFFHYVS